MLISRRVAAFDLSLTATGCAFRREHVADTLTPSVWSETLEPPSTHHDGMRRMSWMRREVLERCNSDAVGLVVFEDFSFGSNDPGMHARAWLAYEIRRQLWLKGSPYMLVAPKTLKKFVTGNGSANKTHMVKAVRYPVESLGVNVKTDHEADAVGLLWIAQCLIGERLPQNPKQAEVVKLVRSRNADLLSRLTNESPEIEAIPQGEPG